MMTVWAELIGPTSETPENARDRAVAVLLAL